MAGEKLSRNTALVVLLAMLGSVGGVTVYGLESLKQDRAVVAENKQEIGNMKANLEWIKVTVEENHQNLNDIKEQIEAIHMTPDQLKKLITDAVNEAGISGMRRRVSDTAEYGDYTRGKRIITKPL